jgi:transposase-like protein
MPLQQDERALLQLVCERGQSYSDLAGLLGISEPEVREKARQALTKLGGTDPDTEVGLTDYLLGQADPIGRADAVRHLQRDPETLELARELETKLAAIAPAARLPKLPEPRGKRRRAAAPPAGEPLPAAAAGGAASTRAAGADEATRARAERPPRSPQQNRIIAGAVGAGIVLLVVILAIAGVFSGDDSSSASDSDSGSTTAEEARDITSVDLTATDDSGVAGTANFGLANETTLFVDLQLEGLDPEPAKRHAYVLWLMITDVAGYPVQTVTPDQNGAVATRLSIPAPVAAVIGGSARSVKVSDTDVNKLDDAIQKAQKAQAPIVPFSGTELASGEIPLQADSTGGATAPSTPPTDETPSTGSGNGNGNGGG